MTKRSFRPMSVEPTELPTLRAFRRRFLAQGLALALTPAALARLLSGCDPVEAAPSAAGKKRRPPPRRPDAGPRKPPPPRPGGPAVPPAELDRLEER